MHEDFSYNLSRNPTSEIRRANLMHQSSFKAYSQDIIPLGDTAAIKIHIMAQLVECSIHRFELKRWNELNHLGLKLPRSKCPIKQKS